MHAVQGCNSTKAACVNIVVEAGDTWWLQGLCLPTGGEVRGQARFTDEPGCAAHQEREHRHDAQHWPRAHLANQPAAGVGTGQHPDRLFTDTNLAEAVIKPDMQESLLPVRA